MISATVLKQGRTVCCLALLCFSVHVIRSGMTWIPLRLTAACPPLILSSDAGRMGNKFFEFLASTLMAEVGRRDAYAATSFANLYDRYFAGRKTPKRLPERCRVDDSQVVSLSLNTFDKLEPHHYADKAFVRTTGYPFQITTEAWRRIFQRRNELIQLFQWRPELKSAVEWQMRLLKTERQTSVVVGIHVRMTDYYKYLIAYYGSFRQADSVFFTKAMDYFRQKYWNPIFLVITNDLNWCVDNLKGDDIFYPSEGDEDDPGWDLAILSSCDHLILTYGTFGYMAAWFKGSGEILVADNYTIRPEEMFERLKAANPPNWIYLNV